MKIADLPDHEKPREKLMAKGPRALFKRELLAILLRTGTKGKSALDIAQKILDTYGANKLLNVSYAELKNLHGVGPTKATQILAALELGRRLLQEKPTEKEVFILTPEDAVKELAHIRANKKENFVILCLDGRNRLICQETISIGTLNASLVHPREVFEPALRNLCASVILAHNHPSGDPEPSEADLQITQRLIQAGRILGIHVADHIIVTKDNFLSFKEKGLLTWRITGLERRLIFVYISITYINKMGKYVYIYLSSRIKLA